jgi:hypothetical protein
MVGDGRQDTGKGAGMLVEELLRTIQAERAREIAAAQRIRSAEAGRAQKQDRHWFQRLDGATPTFGGRPHPGRAAADPTL